MSQTKNQTGQKAIPGIKSNQTRQAIPDQSMTQTRPELIWVMVWSGFLSGLVFDLES
jgi:hypothetical protein